MVGSTTASELVVIISLKVAYAKTNRRADKGRAQLGLFLFLSLLAVHHTHRVLSRFGDRRIDVRKPGETRRQ
ncbi:MAG: hypothetical protein ACI90V_012784 [Bacillariaceae sp.]|jgi:hypothetical protein